MISTDFAPNESWRDAFTSLRMLVKPHKWADKKYTEDVKKLTLSMFPGKKIFFYLTGRAALFFIIKSLKLPKQSEVLVQAFTCAAVPLPVIAADSKPVYVDIESDTYSMDIADLAKKYSPNAKVLILQHTYGFTPKYRREILTFAREKNIMVIEDIAHGWNPETLDNPQTLLLSFGRSKALSSVFGGAIITDDPAIQKSLTMLELALTPPSATFIFRSLLYKPLSMIIKSTYNIAFGKILHAITKKLNLLIPEITPVEKAGEFDTYLAKSYPPVLAALLLKQLDRFQEVSKIRSASAVQYAQKFNSNHIHSGPVTRYPVRISNRDQILKQAAYHSIYLGNWYNRPIGGVSFDLETIGYVKGSCPNAELISKEIINLPTLIDRKNVKKITQFVDLKTSATSTGGAMEGVPSGRSVHSSEH